MVTLTELITWASLGIGAIVGFLQIRATIIKSRHEQQEAIKNLIASSDSNIIGHIDDKLKVVQSKFDTYDTKIEKGEEDIQDIEVDMKNMVIQFREMCEKLSRHDFIISDIVPEFKNLQKEFNHFRTAVDLHLYGQKDENLVNSSRERTSKGSDEGNRENISKKGDIQE